MEQTHEGLYARIRRAHQVPTALISSIEAKSALLRSNIKPPAPAGQTPAHLLLSALVDDGYGDVARNEIAAMKADVKTAFKRVEKTLMGIRHDAKMHRAVASFLEGSVSEMSDTVTDPQLRAAAYALDVKSPEALAISAKLRAIADEADAELERIAPAVKADGSGLDTRKSVSNPCWYNQARNAADLVLAKQTRSIFEKLHAATGNRADKRSAKAAYILVGRYQKIADMQLRARKQIQVAKGASR